MKITTQAGDRIIQEHGEIFGEYGLVLGKLKTGYYCPDEILTHPAYESIHSILEEGKVYMGNPDTSEWPGRG